jgi:pyridoxal phosphate enzyme (YggS family)
MPPVNAGTPNPVASTPDPEAVRELADARERVLATIAEAAARSGRQSGDVTLVAVSKTVPPERIRAATAAGLELFGENRVQEAAAKVEEVPGARWHLVGPLQANKARRAIGLFEAIESVDSLALALRLDRLAREVEPVRRLTVYLQVNVDDDPSKAGFDPSGLERALPELLGLAGLRVAGLMTIGRLVSDAEQARPTFGALRDLSARLRSAHPELGPGLSMGMSDDYPVAVQEGATVVRVGRALFGERPPATAPDPA